MFHKIKAVTPLSGLRLLVHFQDGEAKQYNLNPLMETEPFKDLNTIPGLFEQVSVDPGGYGISWNDDIDMDGSELWANGEEISTPFVGLLALSDATQLWGLSESTLRKAISYGRFQEGQDAMKYGKQWVVTRSAMIREYGPIP
jgi:hypothetical protein